MLQCTCSLLDTYVELAYSEICTHALTHTHTSYQNEKLFTCKTAEEIRKLVKERAVVDTRKADGRTPLIVHTALGNKEVVQELIEHKANVDLQDDDGWSALMIASNRGFIVIVQQLVYAGAIPDLKSKDVSVVCVH